MKGTPCVIKDRVVWQSGINKEPIIIDTPVWFEWLEKSSCFIFKQDENSTDFTAYKERSQKRGGYWKAYYRSNNKFQRVYLGKSHNLNLGRLVRTAQLLKNQKTLNPNSNPQPLSQEVLDNSSSLITSNISSKLKKEKIPKLPPKLEPVDQPTTNLLISKTLIPLPRKGQVVRRDLLKQLDEALQSKLIIISAGGGYGKTTLLSTWATQADRKVAWVALDENDNEPSQFWSYICAAFNEVAPGISQTTLALLQTVNPSIKEVLITLLNSLTTAQLEIVLVLDDFHLLHNKAIHDSLSFFLEQLPPFVHLVLSGRIEPTALPLPRLRARHLLTELRGEDLRFSTIEAAAFFRQTMHIELTQSEVNTITSRTEGWVTGLQLLALSLKNNYQFIDRSSFIGEISGNQAFLIDYLSTEIVADLPRPVQNFLFQTSILKRMNASLCEAVTGNNQSQKMLEYLEQCNLFITALDFRREWYRYHHLFAQYLRKSLEKQLIDGKITVEINQLHLRASRWYAEHNYIEDAIEHALWGNDWLGAVELVEAHAEEKLRHNEINTVLSWLAKLPSGSIEQRPRLALVKSWCELFSGRLEATENYLQTALRLSHHQPDLRGEVLASQAALATRRQQIDVTLELSQEAFRYLPDNNKFVRALLLLSQGNAYLIKGEMVLARQALTQAYDFSRADHNLMIAATVISRLGLVETECGNLREAGRLYREGLQLTVDSLTGHYSPAACMILVSQAYLFYQRNELDQAMNCLDQVRQIATKLANTELIIFSYSTQTLILVAQNRLEEADDILNLAETLVGQQLEKSFSLKEIKYHRAYIWIHQNKLDAAQAWANDQDLNPEGEITYLNEADYIMLIWLRLAQGRGSEILGLLKRLLKASQQGRRNGKVIRLLALQAVVYYDQKEISLAYESLEQALLIGQTQDYKHVFLVEGRPMQHLLVEYLAARPNCQSEQVNYVKNLLEAFGPSPEFKEIQIHLNSQKALLTPKAGFVTILPGLSSANQLLSNREIEVLRLVAKGYSNSQIGRSMILASGTIKKHLDNINRKLETTSRDEAVKTALQAGWMG